ncbi:YraN family protein [Gordonia jinhuaensis]|uniref:UPF0102 protein GCM10011489_18030 n=1 Tax=Gordonia jinhuaensis TaxID=1517702 RepID=A0A916T3L9_9ACTN|nr:YraN family protein [Gordonia jinhuaensis]GGB30270.1 UPF0102 protein [Gordonia jinhuaensis]
MSRAELGRWGEDVAAEYLGSLGWVILERNWCAVRSVAGVAGELDIIAVDGETLVVVEVKTRAGGLYDDPAEAVTRAKLAKMRSLTRAWLSGSERYWPTVRFDVVSVHRDDIDDRRIRHLRGVF